MSAAMVWLALVMLVPACVTKKTKTNKAGTTTTTAPSRPGKVASAKAGEVSTHVSELMFVRYKKGNQETGAVDIHVGIATLGAGFLIKTPAGKVHELKQDRLSPIAFTLEMPLAKFAKAFPNGKYTVKPAGAKGPGKTDAKVPPKPKAAAPGKGASPSARAVVVSGVFPSYPEPVYPKPGATGVPRQPTFRWKRGRPALSFAISVEEAKTGKYVMSKELKASSASSKLPAKLKLKANARYLLFLEALNSSGHRGSIMVVPFTTAP